MKNRMKELDLGNNLMQPSAHCKNPLLKPSQHMATWLLKINSSSDSDILRLRYSNFYKSYNWW